jgi:hypothetical protein
VVEFLGSGDSDILTIVFDGAAIARNGVIAKYNSYAGLYSGSDVGVLDSGCEPPSLVDNEVSFETWLSDEWYLDQVIPSGTVAVRVSHCYQVYPNNVVVENQCGVSPCIADMNGDDSVDSSDLVLFLVAFELGDPAADMNGDGAITIEDLLIFMSAFENGC